jgi:hypothetical protein
MARLLWVSPHLRSGPLHDGASHELASIRYRLLMPARALAALGVESEVLDPAGLSKVSDFDPGPFAAIVIGKLAHDDPQTVRVLGVRILDLVKTARARGVRTIADVCDDRFAHAVLGPYWSELVRSVDHVVTCSDELAGIIRERTAVAVSCVGDPVEGAQAAARFVPPRRRGWLARVAGRTGFAAAAARPLRVLWYGHPTNFDELAAFVPRLAAWAQSQTRIDRIEFTIVSAPGFGAEAFAARSTDAGANRMQVLFVPWSRDTQARALEACDLVVIPATLDSAEKRVKSANRLTEALWAGRHVLAHPVPAYLPFRECAWIGEDLLAGLAAALDAPQPVSERIRNGQGLIGRDYSPQAVGARWAQIACGWQTSVTTAPHA